nr:hypothetical protein [uncultured Treponema sp.]
MDQTNIETVNEVISNEKNLVLTKIKEFSDYISLLQNYWSVLLIFIAVIGFIIYVLRSSKRINLLSKKVLDDFKRQKKYIPHLFTEIDNTMEFLRYFVYGKKWKKKLINKFNSIFSKDKYFKTIAMNNDLIYK